MNGNYHSGVSLHSNAPMFINQTASDLKAEGMPGDISTSDLTPTALLAYLQLRLRGIDDQISLNMKKQQTSNDSSSALSKLQSQLQKFSAADIPKDGDGDAQRNEIQGDFQKALDATKNDPAAHAAVTAQYQVFLRTAGMTDDAYGIKPDLSQGADSNNGILGSEFKNMTDALGQAQKDLNASAEINMIHLQSLISSRQSIVQMGTGMQQNIDDTLKGITAKIGA
jgi:hypothetical protein